MTMALCVDVSCPLQDSEESEKVTLDVSPGVLRSIAQADLGRKSTQNGSSKEDKDAEKKLSDQMVWSIHAAFSVLLLLSSLFT